MATSTHFGIAVIFASCSTTSVSFFLQVSTQIFLAQISRLHRKIYASVRGRIHCFHAGEISVGSVVSVRSCLAINNDNGNYISTQSLLPLLTMSNDIEISLVAHPESLSSSVVSSTATSSLEAFEASIKTESGSLARGYL